MNWGIADDGWYGFAEGPGWTKAVIARFGSVPNGDEYVPVLLEFLARSPRRNGFPVIDHDSDYGDVYAMKTDEIGPHPVFVISYCIHDGRVVLLDIF